MVRWFAFCCSGFLALILAGCASVSHSISLPTTAAIRAPLASAQASVAQAVGIDRQERLLAAVAGSKGIAAGSEEARELSTLTLAGSGADAAVQDQLSAALYQVGALDKEQAAKQAQIDALSRHDAAETARVSVLAREKWDWELAVIALFVLDALAGNAIQIALRAIAAFSCRAVFALAKHLAAFWPLLLACV